MLNRLSRRNSRGYALAELPAGLYLLFVGVGIPLLILASMLIRVFLLYHVAQTTCTMAARERTFTEARTAAAQQFDRAIDSWAGLSGTHRFEIMIREFASGRTTIARAPLAAGSIRPADNAYIVRIVVDGQVEPLIRMPDGWHGLSIPGLTAPYELSTSYISYFENPAGLTN